MDKSARVRVYIACSLDGFIAGPDDDLSWLSGADPEDAADGSPAPNQVTDALEFDAFLAQVGALLMGRRTFDVVDGFDGPWPYGDRPVLVPTHRPLVTSNELVRAAEGDIDSLVEQAKEAAGDKDVYIDGGALIRQALDAGLIDEMVITVSPVVIGKGVPLFAGVCARHDLELVGHHSYGVGMVQVHYRVRPS